MIQAAVIQDSINPYSDRLTTLVVEFPRIILAEFNTHRVFSRNGASSRAIPFPKILQRVLDDPFIPVHLGRNQSGMQAAEEVDEHTRMMAVNTWLLARDAAVEQARSMHALGVHKQIVNRVLEPYMWMTMVVSATEWDNFMLQRAHKDAQPEMQELAYVMLAALNSSTPTPLKWGEWHVPFASQMYPDLPVEEQRKVATARCARTSYNNHDGSSSLEDDIKLFNRLLSGDPIHPSPAEHPAMACKGRWGNFRGFRQLRYEIQGDNPPVDSRVRKHAY